MNGSSSDNEDEECSPSQYWKARLEEESDVEESDKESGNAVESEGSAGPPSLESFSADDDDECTYWQNFLEEETAKRRQKNQEPTAEDRNSRKV